MAVKTGFVGQVLVLFYLDSAVDADVKSCTTHSKVKIFIPRTLSSKNIISEILAAASANFFPHYDIYQINKCYGLDYIGLDNECTVILRLMNWANNNHKTGLKE